MNDLTLSRMNFHGVIGKVAARRITASQQKIGMIDHLDEFIASIKCAVANARNTLGNRNTRQATATWERRSANARETVGERYTRQAATTWERIATNARNTVTKRKTRQTTAITERILVNVNDTVANRYAC